MSGGGGAPGLGVIRRRGNYGPVGEGLDQPVKVLVPFGSPMLGVMPPSFWLWP